MLSCRLLSSVRTVAPSQALSWNQSCYYGSKARSPQKSDADFQPRISVSGPGSDISTALFVQAKKADQTDVVFAQLKQLKSKFKEDIQFWGNFSSGAVTEGQLKKLGCAEPLFEALVAARNGKQLSNMAKIMRQFNEMVAAEPKEMDAVVTVASGLSKQDQEKLLGDLKKEFPGPLGNANIQLKQKVDMSLLEGYTFQAEEFYIDRSASTRLAQFEAETLRKIDAYFGSKISEAQAHKGWY